jgi:hypothetical protein
MLAQNYENKKKSESVYFKPFIDKKEFFTVCKSNENYSNKITELCHVHDSKALFNETQMMVAFLFYCLMNFSLGIFVAFQVRFLVSFLIVEISIKIL